MKSVLLYHIQHLQYQRQRLRDSAQSSCARISGFHGIRVGANEKYQGTGIHAEEQANDVALAPMCGHMCDQGGR